MGLALLFQSGAGSGGSPATAGAATNLYFIFNDAGASASDVPILAGATATGYSATDILVGPRSTMWRSASSSNAEIGYTYSVDVPITHTVITRADLFNSAAGKHLAGQQRSSGGVWSDISGFSYNITDTSNFVGPRTQDMVIVASPTQVRGVAIFTQALSGSEAMQFAKLSAGTAFQFSVPPSIGLDWSNYAPGTYASPMQATWQYEVERSFALRFDQLAQSEVVAFLAKTNLFYWPFHIYDSAGDVWQHKLEHVILTDLVVEMVSQNNFTLQIELNRLRHYD